MPYIFSCYYPLKQCLVWYSSLRVVLKSNQILVGYTHKFCATIAPAYIAGNTPLQVEGLLALLSLTFLLWLHAEDLPLAQKQVRK